MKIDVFFFIPEEDDVQNMQCEWSFLLIFRLTIHQFSREKLCYDDEIKIAY